MGRLLSELVAAVVGCEFAPLLIEGAEGTAVVVGLDSGPLLFVSDGGDETPTGFVVGFVSGPLVLDNELDNAKVGVDCVGKAGVSVFTDREVAGGVVIGCVSGPLLFELTGGDVTDPVVILCCVSGPLVLDGGLDSAGVEVDWVAGSLVFVLIDGVVDGNAVVLGCVSGILTLELTTGEVIGAADVVGFVS